MDFFTLLKLKKTYTFGEYLALAEDLAGRKDTTGPDKTPERIEATKINAVRLKRIYKTVSLQKVLTDEVNKIEKPSTWLLIVEPWCGDGAQCAPVIARVAELSPNVTLKIILRDEHPEIMDKYLTNGARAIPKLVFFDTGSLKEMALWGPRPQAIQQPFLNYKKSNPQMPHEELMKELHLLYARDQGQAIQQELADALRKLIAGQEEVVTL